MGNKQKRLQEVYEHLRRWYGIHTQTDFANSMRYSRNAISLALNGNEKYLTDSLFKNICEAYPGVFDIDYLLTGKGALLTVEEEVRNVDIDKNINLPKPEIPDFVKQLCEETARLATRNELLERQCENLIAELRASKDKNDAFLLELRKSQEFNDSLVADLKISRTQNDALITELRESRKKFDAVVKELDGLKDQFSMALSQHPKFTEEDLGVLRVNDKGEAILTIQVPPVKATTKSKSKSKTNKTPVGYIRGNVKFITEKMVKQAIDAFQPKGK
jgi:transcriptional regulator with XRE-family HTH domain